MEKFETSTARVYDSHLAVLHIALDIGMQDLDIVEDHGEGHKARGHCYGREDHGGESRRFHAALRVHFLVFHHGEKMLKYQIMKIELQKIPNDNSEDSVTGQTVIKATGCVKFSN